jgi:hypothetical protein
MLHQVLVQPRNGLCGWPAVELESSKQRVTAVAPVSPWLDRVGSSYLLLSIARALFIEAEARALLSHVELGKERKSAPAETVVFLDNPVIALLLLIFAYIAVAMPLIAAGLCVCSLNCCTVSTPSCACNPPDLRVCRDCASRNALPSLQS